jgi:hypothetical protein
MVNTRREFVSDAGALVIDSTGTGRPRADLHDGDPATHRSSRTTPSRTPLRSARRRTPSPAPTVQPHANDSDIVPYCNEHGTDMVDNVNIEGTGGV